MARKNSHKKKWYSEGIRFECQGSGNCCTSRGEYGYVYFNSDDRKRAAKVLKITTSEFTKKYCQKVDGFWALKDNSEGLDCIFLKNKKCSMYQGRPTQCRTWPFWPEVMHAKKWKKDLESYCPGVNKGRLYTETEIKSVLAEQKAAEQLMQQEAQD